MQSAHAIHKEWHPQTRQDREVVLSELETILASPHFCNSKRYPALLRFLVESALAGNAELLKERILGVEVFERPADYDTNTDTVVRYTAGEVRKRLLLYYSEQSEPSHIRISLPAGSYVPEFFQWPGEPKEAATDVERHATFPTGSDSRGHRRAEADNPREAVSIAGGGEISLLESHAVAKPAANYKRLVWVLLIVMLLALTTGAWWKHQIGRAQNEVDAFWAPVVRGQQTLIVCTGGSMFATTADNKYSGVGTAGKDVVYPFVSWQSVSAAVQVSSMLSRAGVATQLTSGPSTPLTDLREHSVVLLGAYNNQWTMHLQQSLRYYFLPGTDEVHGIVDRAHPEVQWKRDESQPYSSADDYAIVARFHDTTTNGWVVVLAGVGRNGTEAAAQFVTIPNYMQLLRARVGTDFSNRNIEAVLKTTVIEGKTGAPAIVAVATW